MTQPIQPLLVPVTSGFVPSFANVRLNAAGMDFSGGFAELKYDVKVVGEQVESNNMDPVGETIGTAKYTASGKFYRLWLINFIAQITNQLGPGWAAQPFNVYVGIVADLSIGQVTQTDTLLSCKLRSLALAGQKGNSALTGDIDLSPLKILINGVDNNPCPLGSANA
jgi:hypothetical protein